LALQARVLGPMGAIVATTKTNAEIIGRQDDLGTVETGKLADLVLVNADPLKNMGVFKNYHENITLIVQGGRIYKNIL
jgi:imidazolonepropionase-like amidohydrolase